MINNANDYDKFAEKRQQDLINGMMPSHRFVEKPMMKNMLSHLNGKKVLMLGCGTGEESKLLETFGAEPNLLTGIDLSEKSIELANKTYPNINFVVGDMNNLPFEDNTFDFVYSSLTIHYTSTPEKVYEKVYRVLKPNGTFLFSIAHPLRWASEEKEIDNEVVRITGCSKADNQCNVFGHYNTFRKYTHSSFAWQKGDEVLSFYVGSPSLHFKLLRNAGFDVIDFTESKCVEACKEVDMNYYTKNSEIPQFMAFLSKK